MSRASVAAGGQETVALTAELGIPLDLEASACSLSAAAGVAVGHATLLVLVILLPPVDTVGLARILLCWQGASAFRCFLVGSAGQTCPSVSAGGG